MAVDWTNPTNTRNYANVLGDLTGRDLSLAKMDYGSDTNIPTGARRYSGGVFETWNGSAWVNLNTQTAFSTTLTGGGSMTLSSSVQFCSYWRGGPNGDLTFLSLDFTATTGGTAAPEFNFTLPSGRSAAKIQYVPVWLKVSNGYELGMAFLNGTGGTLYRNPLFSNWPLGANQGIWCTTLMYLSN